MSFPLKEVELINGAIFFLLQMEGEKTKRLSRR